MIESAKLQRVDELLHQLGTGGPGGSSQDDQNILLQIQQILAGLFDDSGSSFPMPLMPSMPSGASTPARAVNASYSNYSGSSGSGAVPAGNGTGQCTSASTAEGKKTAQDFMTNLQRDFGLTKNQAAGIVANLWHESGGMNTGINQGGTVGAPNSNMQCGYGIAQWTGSRKQDYLDYCSQHSLNPASEQANYGFLKHELETTQSGAIDAVKHTQSAQDATVAFCNTFERPGDPQMSSRLADLQYVLSAA
jgi:hypothetical protein